MKKGQFVHHSLNARKMSKVVEKSEVITWSRATIIQSNFVGKVFKIHNGAGFFKVPIGDEMVGYRLGEFSRTRKRGKDPRPKISSRRKGLVK